ncbi:MAG: hypothetical protein OHK0013_29910 [Sandaracinaceae bacterium]
MSAPKPLVDAEARRRIAEDLDATFVVEAAAGTGKTTALVSRIVGLLATGRATAASLVATTFTEKAAGELVVRTREALERGKDEPHRTDDERARLVRAIAELETARIGTIHGLAADLLREHPIEAGIDPSFQVHGEEESAELLERVVSRWLEDRLASPTPVFARLTRRGAPGGETLRSTLVKVCMRLADRRELTTPWRGPSFDRATRIDEVLATLAALGPTLARAEAEGVTPSNKLFASLEALHAAHARIRASSSLSGARDDDAAEAILVELARGPKCKRGSGKMFGKRLREEVVAELDRAEAMITAFQRDADGDLAAKLHPELLAAVASYEAEKRRLGVVDYADLLISLRRLLAENAAVRARLQARFTHVLVDEVQDTDPVQLEIVRLLVADDPATTDPRAARPKPGKLFVVGDPKQAIYRFRRADLDAYLEARAALRDMGAEILHLTTSFRAEPTIQAAVNAALGLGESALPEYVPLSPFRAARTDRPSVVVLPVPRPYGQYKEDYFQKSMRASYPAAVGAFVAWLVSESGWTVEEDGREVPVAPHHVAILFKQMQGGYDGDLVRPYVEALELRGVPIRSAERRAFFEREEIHALRTVLTAIEWVDDEIAVYGALRGLFLALSDAELLQYQREHGSLHPLRVPRAEERAPGAKRPPGEDVADALRLLRGLHVARNHRPFAETIERFLDATRAHALLALSDQGERALANVRHLVGMARRAEARGVLSFRRFVEELEARAEEGRQGEVTTEDDTVLGVQLSTVHGFKGLELPVIVLADPAAPPTIDKPSSYTDRARGVFVERIAGIAPLELSENQERARTADIEEARRLLYVAATRARDLLVVPSVGDGPTEGWCRPLEVALRPRGTARRPAPAPGCPSLEAFGDDTVLARSGDALFKMESTIQPGLHPFGDPTAPFLASGAVTWWGPRALALEATHAKGVRATELLAKPSNAPASFDDGSARSKALELARARRLERVTGGSDAEREPLSVLAQKPLALASTELDVEDVRCPRSFPAAASTRKTELLLRGALAVAITSAPEPARVGEIVLQATRYVGRSLGCTAHEIEAGTEILGALTEIPALASLLAAPCHVRAEPWVALATSTGSLGEGRAPVVIERDDVTWVIGLSLEGDLLDAHRTELALAATAIARARPTTRARLFVIPVG